MAKDVHAEASRSGYPGPRRRSLVDQEANEWRVQRDRCERTDDEAHRVAVMRCGDQSYASGVVAQDTAELRLVEHIRVHRPSIARGLAVGTHLRIADRNRC